jgi:hypothetical protein
MGGHETGRSLPRSQGRPCAFARQARVSPRFSWGQPRPGRIRQALARSGRRGWQARRRSHPRAACGARSGGARAAPADRPRRDPRPLRSPCRPARPPGPPGDSATRGAGQPRAGRSAGEVVARGPPAGAGASRRMVRRRSARDGAAGARGGGAGGGDPPRTRGRGARAGEALGAAGGRCGRLARENPRPARGARARRRFDRGGLRDLGFLRPRRARASRCREGSSRWYARGSRRRAARRSAAAARADRPAVGWAR